MNASPSRQNLKIWLNAGEPSGDMQSAALLRELKAARPGLLALGMGGPLLEAEGMNCVLRVEQLSVMGAVEVLSYLPGIFRMLRLIRRRMTAEKPDAVILTDAPDFNFFVARIAEKLHIPVYYFIPPKVWAHREGRVAFLRKHTRRIFSILPFETEFYRRFGMEVEYVGNPLVDIVDYPSIASIQPVAGRVGLMPGSRRREIESLLPAFSAAADILLESRPDLRFHLIRAPRFDEDYLRSFWKSRAPLIVENPENRYAFMRSCQFIAAASGTATLETGLAGVPTLVAYKVSPLSYAIGRRVIKVQWASLTNLILNREVFPEHIQAAADPEPVAARLKTWLEHPEQLEEIRAACAELRSLCGEKGSAGRAARSLLADLQSGANASGSAR